MKKDTNKELFEILDFGLGDNAVSHTETTGTFPIDPNSNEEVENYLEIDNFRQKPIIPPKRRQ